MIYLNIAVEDALSEVVLMQLVERFGDKYSIKNVFSRSGFGYLKSSIRGFNQASQFTPFLMLTDLDNYDCPLDLIGDWINFDQNNNLIFRIAVREVESWLLADARGLADFFRISKAKFPLDPESLSDPKNTLIHLARKSRIRKIQEDIIPVNETAAIGPNYNGCLSEFVFNQWNIDNALKHSRSLNKAYRHLSEFEPTVIF